MMMSLCSCEKMIDIQLPRNELTEEKVFGDSSSANAAIMGVYARIQGGLGFLSGSMTIYPGMSADELVQQANNENTQFQQNILVADNGTIDVLWTSAYTHIYSLNACIEGLNKSTSMNASVRSQLVAEALCLRSLVYFYLINLYGPVPLVLTTDYGTNRILPRSSKAVVYENIINDLQKAKVALHSTAVSNLRVNRFFASALLARVFLFTKRYQEAADEATAIIENKQFHLADTPEKVFAGGSRELISVLSVVYPGRATWEGYTFVPSSVSSVPAYMISGTLLAAFEGKDLRGQQWIRMNEINGVKNAYPYKYQSRDLNSGARTEQYAVLRIAEQYLIRAEANLKQGNMEKVFDDLDVIRKRAGLEELARNMDMEKLLMEVERQKRLEFFCEWGHRWFDLKRTGRVDTVMSSLKPGWSSDANLYPIPRTQIERNSSLTQNKGY
ncbi:RagB/SusD family nutrient uptake outer membrane protein [Sphingobacterium sp. UDSM-2020]|uniref:RagB/SusD family nutrient uptake outer membrane protein n=1 Tax=Sphingobacterium sp. UDSM-2020 TaxID=2795738 RepID=UPI00193816F5|nr:RagB/SusD family nutrient uptake outer membrane protein [Sphingobacterium sp. UDSM-2020]QQD15825.1 RagB/SusD family nutrient uptake outer membrane protein [Sphingobacterium sp. UDSM-2020]